LNAADKHHLSFMEKLLPLAVEKQLGNHRREDSGAGGRIVASWKLDPQKQGGFEGNAPGPGTPAMREAMQQVISQPVSPVMIGCDAIALLEENMRFAREFIPLRTTAPPP
jgi:hypothetical protein